MRVLAISCFVPGSAAAFVDNGRLIAASAEERFTRVPGDSAFPERAIRFCLEQARVMTGRTTVDRVACVDRAELAPAPVSRTSLSELKSAVVGWTDKQSLRRRIRGLAEVTNEQIVFVDPLRAQAANAFMPAPFETAAIVVADGNGEHTVTATGVGSGAALDLEAVARQDVDGAVLGRIVADAAAHAGSTHVCLAGSRVVDPCMVAHAAEAAGVSDVFVPPAVDGLGAALGAAWHVHHLVTGAPREFVVTHPYWGHSLDRRAVVETAQASGLVWVECDEDELLARAADLLSLGHVLGWAQEAAECGPRGLGNRSVICDPANPDAVGRMPWLSEAPDDRSAWTLAVPEERLDAICNGVRPGSHRAARFGAIAARPRQAVADVLAMPTHLDGTIAIHAVSRDTAPRLHALLERLSQKTPLPALAQTALAPRGEPLANTARDAFRAFQDWKLGALVLDHIVMLGEA